MIPTTWSDFMLLAQAATELAGLNTWGWMIMLVSVGAVVLMTAYCMYRVLSLPPIEVEDLKSPLDIDTGDTEDAD